MRNVISNTSCLIALSNCKHLDVLKMLYGRIIITPEVADEFDEPLPDFIKIVPVMDTFKVKAISNILDLGESSTIALYLETEDAIMILDDGKARRFASNMKLRYTGTLGVIAKASKIYQAIKIDVIIDDLRRCGFRIPKDIEELLLGD